MVTTSGIWNQAKANAGSLALTTMDNSTSGTGSSSTGDSATISANDFLTLLVTEMQNQDPTADTDPNEYINQLVNVNSLEQLIDINQTLSTATSNPGNSASASGTNGGRSGDRSTTTNGASSPQSIAGRNSGSVPVVSGVALTTQNAVSQFAPGNLSIPNTSTAAQRVAQSLSGH